MNNLWLTIIGTLHTIAEQFQGMLDWFITPMGNLFGVEITPLGVLSPLVLTAMIAFLVVRFILI